MICGHRRLVAAMLAGLKEVSRLKIALNPHEALTASETSCNTELKGGKLICIVGGYGRRLWPLNREIDKPLLPVGDRWC